MQILEDGQQGNRCPEDRSVRETDFSPGLFHVIGYRYIAHPVKEVNILKHFLKSIFPLRILFYLDLHSDSIAEFT